jgi:NAD(P)-dependent dehydrogenase (short-subunit alcohol dehydrogenase family)
MRVLAAEWERAWAGWTARSRWSPAVRAAWARRTSGISSREGAKVVFGDVLDGADLAADVGAACRFVRMDVTSEDGWAAAVRSTVQTFGKLDVLVNNADILIFRRITAMPLDEFRRVIDVNLTAERGSAQQMVAAACQDGLQPGYRCFPAAAATLARRRLPGAR